MTTHCNGSFDLWGGGGVHWDDQRTAAAAAEGLCAEVLSQHEEVHMLFLCQHKAVNISSGTCGEGDNGGALDMAGVEAALWSVSLSAALSVSLPPTVPIYHG